ncbi:hypothetical protein CHS0354_037075 [Potamilus streckersoni]|uniref:Carbohydrate kinase PfkB domain-containing protein n=1 Tax=Potamilus streckersoni TaxID=2493646 RepID=A0AAE0W0V7_9BIVA|nr:hypothetical protein CHS0354_037075 [Potamilus streckersoni]
MLKGRHIYGICRKCQKWSLITQRWISLKKEEGVIKVSDEVSSALHEGLPVVALESTIITHGMPHPDNLNTALDVEKVIRENGAVPATVAALKGKIHVGLSKTELEILADPATSSIKISRRDFPIIVAQGLTGGTTVSGTMLVAHKVGIPVFVTGGIGGVHRGVESTWDVSADLTELGKTPVAVVSSGVKSILDIGKTLEYLETEGVCVATFGPDKNFPAFFSRTSGFMAPYNIESALDAAKLIDSRVKLGLQTGTLIAVPIPNEFSAEGKEIEQAIQEAVNSAREKEIVGKEVTPYILNKVSMLTKGLSLKSNIALIKNNARVGAQIGVELSRLWYQSPGSLGSESVSHRGHGYASGYQSESGRGSQSAFISGKIDRVSQNVKTAKKGRVVVVGGSIVDFNVRLKTKDFKANGATYSGIVQQSFGGVGRNLADCLAKLGMDPLFLSAVGRDPHLEAYRTYCRHMDLSGVVQIDDISTATYCAIMRESGELMFGIGDMDIHSHITPKYLSKFEKNFIEAPLVCIDGNISPDSIQYISDLCGHSKVPVFYEPTDIHKAAKPLLSSAYKHVTYTSPNFSELKVIFGLISSEEIPSQIQDVDESELESVLFESFKMGKTVCEQIPVVIVTLGKHGVLICRHGDHTARLPLRGCDIKREGEVTGVYYPVLREDNSSSIISVSGAGDCLAATMIAGIVKGYDPDLCVKAGLHAASHSLSSHHAVPDTIRPWIFDSELVQKSSIQPRILKVDQLVR